MLKKNEGGTYRRDAFWVCEVTEADYNAAVVDTVNRIPGTVIDIRPFK